jgi:hypothetical protein
VSDAEVVTWLLTKVPCFGQSAAFCALAAGFQADISTQDWTKQPALMPRVVPCVPSKLASLYEEVEETGGGGGEVLKASAAKGVNPVPARVQKLLGPCRDFPCSQQKWDACKELIKTITTQEAFDENKPWLLHLCSLHLKRITEESSSVVDVIPTIRSGKLVIAMVAADGTKSKFTLSGLAAKPRVV